MNNTLPKYSVIVPVYNRPGELDELLESLSKQSYKDFEVLVVEDGSTLPCQEVANKYSNSLRLFYFYKENSGPGDSRNYGFARAKGEFFIIFDSDCLVPADFLAIVDQELQTTKIDAFGGPDAAHPNFSTMQKAISYAMTSIWTTGGIRGKEKHYGTFHPRSFNMGISRQVWKETEGFSHMRYGEDIDLSIRIINKGFKTALFPGACVYHKRRNTFRSFFWQVFHSGEARIVLYKKFPAELKLVHFFPAAFVLAVLLAFLVLSWLSPFMFYVAVAGLLIYLGLIFTGASVQYKSLNVGQKSVWASVCMHFGYGLGFISAACRKMLGRL